MLFCFYPELFCSQRQESSKNLGTLNARVKVRMERMTGREDLEIEWSMVKHLKLVRPSVTSISPPNPPSPLLYCPGDGGKSFKSESHHGLYRSHDEHEPEGIEILIQTEVQVAGG